MRGYGVWMHIFSLILFFLCVLVWRLLIICPRYAEGCLGDMSCWYNRLLNFTCFICSWWILSNELAEGHCSFTC